MIANSASLYEFPRPIHYKQKWNNECFEKYLHENVKIITFNYDNSFENIFWENSEITDNSKNFIKNNLKHVYGQIFLKLGKNDQINLTENCLWKGIFSVLIVEENKEEKEIMNLYLSKEGSKEICEIVNTIEQLDENIKWIGQEESQEITKDRKSYYRWLIEAQIVNFFKIDKSVASRHIKNIFKDGEVDKSNMQKMHIVNSDKPVAFYSLGSDI